MSELGYEKGKTMIILSSITVHLVNSEHMVDKPNHFEWYIESFCHSQQIAEAKGIRTFNRSLCIQKK